MVLNAPIAGSLKVTPTPSMKTTSMRIVLGVIWGSVFPITLHGGSGLGLKVRLGGFRSKNRNMCQPADEGTQFVYLTANLLSRLSITSAKVRVWLPDHLTEGHDSELQPVHSTEKQKSCVFFN